MTDVEHPGIFSHLLRIGISSKRCLDYSHEHTQRVFDVFRGQRFDLSLGTMAVVESKVLPNFGHLGASSDIPC